MPRIYTETSRISDRLLQQSNVEDAATSRKEAGKNAKPAGLWMDRVRAWMEDEAACGGQAAGYLGRRYNLQAGAALRASGGGHGHLAPRHLADLLFGAF